MRLLSTIAIAGTMACGTASAQQYVIDTAFCKNVSKNDCKGVLTSGSTVDLSELRRNKGGPVLHFWGSLRNPNESVVGFFFARGGKCYPGNKEIRDSIAKSSNENSNSFVNWARTRTLDDLTSYFIKDAKGEATIGIKGKADVSLSGAIAPPSTRFRVSDFRNVLCEGRVEARLLNSQGSPIPPDANNDVKYLIVTNLKKRRR